MSVTSNQSVHMNIEIYNLKDSDQPLHTQRKFILAFLVL